MAEKTDRSAPVQGRAAEVQEGQTHATSAETQQTPAAASSADAPPVVDTASENHGDSGFETSASEQGLADNNLDVVRRGSGQRGRSFLLSIGSGQLGFSK